MDFPEYASLAKPAPLTIDQVQARLGSNEALVLFVDTRRWGPTPEETFAWVVTKTHAHWIRSELGTPALAREVSALRCGLDASAWETDDGMKCSKLLNIAAPAADAPLPFDASRAHHLYKALFGQVEDLIRDKHLLIVPSGPLTQLPFSVLITAKPAGVTSSPMKYRTMAWLARANAMTVLPVVTSLQALRMHATPSRAAKPLIGIGNPLLDGPDGRYAGLKQAALARQNCVGFEKVQRAANRSGGGVKPSTRSGGVANVAELRQAVPLPETADELCEVARSMGVDEADIFLGARANESEIKRLSDADILRSYRIVHFATHGALAGEVSGSAEPGLVLTPPNEGTESDDGYLTASEIASLKLDADWVVLSACTTAAGAAEGAEALSGLARAFIYAGARALLVSHWYVDSAAAVALIQKTFTELTADPKVGRSDALRRSMFDLIDKGSDAHAHPSAWAPFVVVGEGRPAK